MMENVQMKELTYEWKDENYEYAGDITNIDNCLVINLSQSGNAKLEKSDNGCNVTKCNI